MASTSAAASASRSANTAVLLLFGAYALSINDRMILSVLFEPNYAERSLAMALSVLTLFNLWSAGHFRLCGRAVRSARTQGEIQHG